MGGPVLTEVEKRRILVDWNDTKFECRPECVHRLFEEQVSRTPDAVAVVDGNRQITYRELNEEANSVAHHLQRLGVGPEVMAAICIERSIEMLVGLLGILKAGGAYVPIHPSLPRQRIEFMLQDMDAPLLLCSKRSREDFPSTEATPIVDIEECRKAEPAERQRNPISPVNPDNLAYMLYTSGSTGVPKGVLITHRALANYLAWCAVAYPVDQGSGSPLHSPMCFDLTITSLFPTLLAGSTVFLLPEDANLDTLAETLRGGDFSLVKLTPAHLIALTNKIRVGSQGVITRAFVIGGEALHGETLNWWRQLYPQVRMINEYGPTEATVGCCVFEVPPGFDLRGAVPIGRPIHNVRLYVLDNDLQPVSIGEPGELYIAGESLARGYHRRPDLTAQSFLPDPFSTDPAARVYKTGDLVRWRADGNLEFLGRRDSQIKLRGYRVEIGEIEAKLLQHPGVNEAVVVALGEPPNQRLAAYIVAKRTQVLSEEDLRSFLKLKLPEYMLPARYVFMESLPLTTNGKIDRKALPVSDTSQASNGSSGPRGDIEARLSTIWERVLELRSVGLQDNFFDLGGHSLLASKLLVEVEREFGRKLSMSALFQAPSIERMAFLLRDQLTVKNPRVVPIQPAGSRPPFFCVGAGPIFRALAHGLGRNQPFLGLELGKEDVTAQPYRLEDFAAVHARTIVEAQPEGPYFIGGWSDNGVMAYEVARQLQSNGRNVALLALFDAENPAHHVEVAGLDALLARFNSMSQWIRINWTLLRDSGPEERRERVRAGLKFRRAWIKDHVWGLGYRMRHGAGLQPASEPTDSERLLAYLVRGYHPQRYEGRVILFQRSARPTGPYHDSLFGWGKLISGLEVCEIPGDHRDMFLKPHVEVLARKLGDFLSIAQERSAVLQRQS